MQKKFLRVREINDVFSLSRSTVYKAIKEGELKVYRPNKRDFLLKTEEIEEWIETKATEV